MGLCLSEEQDRYLVKALIEGNAEAWDEVGRCVESWLRNGSKRHYITAEDITDLRQDILTKFIENNYQRLQQFSFRCRLSSWIGSIVNNHLYDHYRINIRREIRDHGFELLRTEMINEIGQKEELLEQIADGAKVESAIESLTPAEKRMVRMAYWDDLKPFEIAKVTGERTTTITSRLTRARAKLKELLIPEGEEGKQKAI